MPDERGCYGNIMFMCMYVGSIHSIISLSDQLLSNFSIATRSMEFTSKSSTCVLIRYLTRSTNYSTELVERWNMQPRYFTS